MKNEFIPESPSEFGKSMNENESIESEDEIIILLPAWSQSSRDTRLAAALPPASTESAPKKSQRWGCIAGLIAALIIFSLVASSLFSLFWFWNLRNERIAEVVAMLDESAGREATEPEGGSLAATDGLGARDQVMAPAPTSLPGEPVNRIVFINKNRQIETIRPDGGDQRQLTADAKSYLFPAWSEDGRLIASIGSTINGTGIYLMPDEAQTSQIEEVHFSVMDSAFYLYWSPDSRKISYLANAHPSGITLNILDLDSEGESRTIAAGSPLYWNWSANSRNMLVHAGSDTSDSQLGMIDSEGWPVSGQIPAPGPFQAPGISQDGRFWAYSQFQAGGTTWLVIDDRLTGEDAAHRHAGSAAFTWSPVKNELAFISGDAHDSASFWGPLRLMDAQTGEIELLSAETVVAFFWSPDGRKIATISVPDGGPLGEEFEVRIEKDRRLARHLSGAAEAPAAQIASNSFHIIVIDVESGQALWRLESGLSTIYLTQFLPYFDQYAFSHQIWSPDSAALVLPLVQEDAVEITRIDADDGQTTKLADGSIAFWSRQ
ncbi:MAG: hypothetical protein ACK2U4_21850 [Candidatus Promineifilaceae bacterium]|jgi:TolB protein